MYGITLQGISQKPDFVANWKGIRTLQVVGGKHEPYPALAGIYVSNSLKKVLINDFTTDYHFHDGMLAIFNRETGRWGFIDEYGNLMPGGYKWKNPSSGMDPQFGCGHCIVGQEAPSTGSAFRHTDYFIIDKRGNAVNMGIQDLSDVFPFNNGGIAPVVKRGTRDVVLFYNTSGNKVFTNVTNAVAGYRESPLGDFVDGWARLRVGNGYTFISNSGTLMPKTFVEAQDFSDGLAAVAVQTGNGKRWGFIDKAGNLVIEAKFSNMPSPFSCGYAVAKKTNGKMVLINKQGNVCSPEEQYYTNFVNGYALCGTITDYSYGSGGGTMWTVDTQLQRKPVQSQILGAGDLGGICQTLPVKTAFNDTYIYYEGEKYLIYPPTGVAYRLDGFASSWDDKFDVLSEKRMHIMFKSKSNGTVNILNGFLDERGVLIFVFDKEEF